MNISPLTPGRVVLVGGLLIHRLNGLQDYRDCYPRTVSVPTLTQLGFVGFLLERSRERSARRERRRAIRQHLIRAILRPFTGLRKAIGHLSAAQTD